MLGRDFDLVVEPWGDTFAEVSLMVISRASVVKGVDSSRIRGMYQHVALSRISGR